MTTTAQPDVRIGDRVFLPFSGGTGEVVFLYCGGAAEVKLDTGGYAYFDVKDAEPAPLTQAALWQSLRSRS